MADTYEKLLGRIREIGQLQSVESLLDWDQETFMPPSAVRTRGEQLSLMARMVHRSLTDPELGDLLSGANGSNGDPIVETNVRETRRSYERAVKLPSELVGRIAEVATHAKAAWVQARQDSDFAKFAPHLEELLRLKRETADLIGFEGERYDALLDEFEPGMSSADVATTFSKMRGPLSEFAQQIAVSGREADTSALRAQYPRDAQERFARKLAEMVGFDFNCGRMDVSTHPFCSGTTPQDVRMTTRYDERFFSSASFGVMHESGHGVYEQGLDTDHMFTPMGSAVSLGIHESQSLLWENMVGRSRAFWDHAYASCQSTFPESLGQVPLDVFYAAINSVHPSFIRVEADEVTYNLHIILRFELEREMIEGRLAVRDVPDAWNASLKDLLGITPGNDREGCLQDIHWSMGTFGYFPTYALGRLYAAQFYAAAERAIPDLTDRIRRGDTGTLLEWLRSNIYRHGQRYRSGELMKVVTGAEPSDEAFMKYIRDKFSPLYGL